MNTLENATDVKSLFDRLSQLTPDTQPRWGRMSAHQVVCHLNDLLSAATGQRPTRVRANWFTRSVVKFWALWVPIHWPRGFRTVRELDQEKGGTRPVEFHADFSNQLQLLREFADRNSNFGHHPLFDQMSAHEWKRWAYLHTDHHLRQFGL